MLILWLIIVLLILSNFIISSVDTYNGFFEDVSQVELAVEKSGILNGYGDKAFYIEMAPYVENKMAELIKSGDVYNIGKYGHFSTTDAGKMKLEKRRSEIDLYKKISHENKALKDE